MLAALSVFLFLVAGGALAWALWQRDCTVRLVAELLEHQGRLERDLELERLRADSATLHLNTARHGLYAALEAPRIELARQAAEAAIVASSAAGVPALTEAEHRG